MEAYVKNFGEFLNENNTMDLDEARTIKYGAKTTNSNIKKLQNWMTKSKEKLEKLQEILDKLKENKPSLKLIDGNKFEEQKSVKFVLTQWEIFKAKADILRYRFELKKEKAAYNDKVKGTSQLKDLRGSEELERMQKTNTNIQIQSEKFKKKYGKAAGLDNITFPNIKL